jgi:hydrogenase small subunit
MGGCPNVGGICMACTMPGFPDKFMPFMKEDTYGAIAARTTQFTYGPILRYFRHRNITKTYDIEPPWRTSKPELRTGYQPRNYARGMTPPPGGGG